MQLNWSTFILEIINFLVLVWILKRMFYTPIKNAIEKRRTTIQQSLDEAHKLHEDAEDLKSQYENRLLDWQKEKEQKIITLKQELDGEKTKALENLKTVIAKEKEKNRAQEERKLQDLVQKTEQQAEVKATKFAAELLKQFASPEIEAEIIKLFLSQLPTIPKKKIALIKDELYKDVQNKIEIVSAFSLTKAEKDAITSTFKKAFNGKITFDFKRDSKLLAGLYVTIGSIIMHANLRDELKFFSETPFHE
jgi:F-type H+-transporting ATPase subunit b